MPIAIAKFFFFDAEKITSLAEINQKDQRRQLSQAYSEVLGIQKYETLKDNLEDKLDEYRKKSAKKEDEQRLNQLEAAIKNADIEIEDCETKISELRDEINLKKHDSEEITLKLVKAGDKMSLDELMLLQEEKAQLEERKGNLQEKLKGIFDFIPFALAGETLANITEQVKNERLLSEQKYKQDDVKEKITKIRQDIESEKQTLQFVPEVRTSDFYIDQIEKLIKRYFYSDVQDVDQNLKTLHEFSNNQTDELNQLISSVRNNFKYQFEALNNEYSHIKNQLDAINRRIRDAEQNAQDSHIADLRDRRTMLDQKISEKEQEIGALNQRIENTREELKKHRQEQSAIRKQTILLNTPKSNKKRNSSLKPLKILLQNSKDRKKSRYRQKCLSP